MLKKKRVNKKCGARNKIVGALRKRRGAGEGTCRVIAQKT